MRATTHTTAEDLGLREQPARSAFRLGGQRPSVRDAGTWSVRAKAGEPSTATTPSRVLPELPWDVMRLILEHVRASCEANTYAGTTVADTPLSMRSAASSPAGTARSRPTNVMAHYSDLARAGLVNRDFCSEVRSLLFRDMNLSCLRYQVRDKALYWILGSPDRHVLAGHVRRLRADAVGLTDSIPSIVRSCRNLRCLELDVSQVERKECLPECLRGALCALSTVEEVHLLAVTSVKAFNIVHSLPYRLQKLVISGYRDAPGVGGFWDNPHEWFDAEEVHFIRSKLDEWNAHFFFTFFEQAHARPPSNIGFSAGYLDLKSVPEVSAVAVRTLQLEEAQQLLDLDILRRFPLLQHLILSTKHDFISLSTSLPQIRRITILVCNRVMAKLLSTWLERGLFAALEQLDFAEDAFRPRERGAPAWDLLLRLEDALRARRQLARDAGIPPRIERQGRDGGSLSISLSPVKVRSVASEA